MPLRYLNLNEPQYIPSYTPLQPQTIAQTSESIAEQGLTAQQYKRDRLDLLGENISSMTGLSERDRQFVQERMNKTRQNLNTIFEEQGARGAMPYVDKEVRDIQNDLQYHKRVSQTKQEALAAIEENDQAPSELKQSIREDVSSIGVKYDQEGNPIGIKGGYNEKDLNTAATWEDWTDDIQSFVTHMKADSAESPQFTASPNQIAVYRKKLKSLGFGKVSSGVVGFLLNHPKYREQLDLLGRTQIGNVLKQVEEQNAQVPPDQEVEAPYTINENGQVLATLRTKVLDANGQPIKEGEDEFGQAIYKTETKIKSFDSPAELMATKIASGYGAQSFFEESYVGTRELKEGDEPQSLNDRFSGIIDYTVPETEPTDYIGKTMKVAKEQDERFKTLQKRTRDVAQKVLGDENVKLKVNSETGEFNFEMDGTSYTLDNLLNETDPNSVEYQQYSKLKDYEKAAKSALTQSRTLTRQLDKYKENILNDLASLYPNLEDYIMGMEIDDSGSLMVDNTTQADFSTVIEELGSGKGNTWKYFGEDNEAKINRMKPGTTNLLTLTGRQIGSAGTGARGQVVSRKGVPVFVNKDEQGNITIHEINKVFGKDFDRITQKHTNAITGAGTYEVPSLLFDDERYKADKAILNILENRPDIVGNAGEGNITTKDGEQVTFEVDSGQRLTPSRMFIGNNGLPVIRGTLHGPNQEDPQVVNWSGELVEDIVQQAYGDEFNLIMAQRALDNILPKLYNGKETVSINSTGLRTIGALSEKGETFDNVKIEIHRNKRNGVAMDDIYVTIPEINPDKPFVVNGSEELQDLLWRKTAEHFGQ